MASDTRTTSPSGSEPAPANHQCRSPLGLSRLYRSSFTYDVLLLNYALFSAWTSSNLSTYSRQQTQIALVSPTILGTNFRSSISKFFLFLLSSSLWVGSRIYPKIFLSATTTCYLFHDQCQSFANVLQYRPIYSIVYISSCKQGIHFWKFSNLYTNDDGSYF